MFIGGSTHFKLGLAAARLAHEAKRRGKWVHMGRVNSRKRIGFAERFRCDSVDGTLLKFAPLSRLTPWITDEDAPDDDAPSYGDDYDDQWAIPSD